MSEYAKNIQTIEDMWKKRIELRREGGGRMSEFIITSEQLKTATEAYLERELSRPITDVFISGDKLLEIVRCRDCKHMHTVRHWLGMDVDECWLRADPESGALGKEPTEPDGFCAWGERR